MKRNNQKKEHPEIKEIKNICDVSPESKGAKTVCNKIKTDKSTHSSQKK